MRVGMWVAIDRRRIPIPRRLALAFGLKEGSLLYLVPLVGQEETHRERIELMVSPVPPQSWRSVCRLSVRLQDVPHSLASAAEFLRRRRINILFSESASTIEHRAHWDAICDLRHTPEFAKLKDMPQEDYVLELPIHLSRLSWELRGFMDEAQLQPKTFPPPHLRHGTFSPLTGLNNASFRWNESEQHAPVTYNVGGIEIAKELAREIRSKCLGQPRALPYYAMITGNTEQSYLRVLFLRDYDNLFRLGVDVTTTNFAAGGAGILQQVLNELPESVNLIQTSSRFMGGGDIPDRGRIEIIAHWEEKRNGLTLGQGKTLLETELPKLTLRDVDGNSHENALQVEFTRTEPMYPPIFVSYSMRGDAEKFEYLHARLLENQFTPVVGTSARDLGSSRQEGEDKRWFPDDVVTHSFRMIDACVALISLQLEHPEFVVRAKNRRPRKIVPPWIVAEEAWAWARDIPVWRLRDEEMELPRYEKHQREHAFRTNDDGTSFREAVDRLIDDLQAYYDSPAFEELRNRRRELL